MSLLCRLKKLAHKGELEEKDLERIMIIPEGATNGDIFRLVYPNVAMVHDIREKKRLSVFADDWWNSPYRKEQE